MSFQLTSGICARLHSPAPGDADILNQPCTLQLLSVKKVSLASANQPTDRYRIIISDGVNYAQAMLATQLNNYVTEGRIAKNTVAKLTKMTSNSVQDKRYVFSFAPVCKQSVSFRVQIDHHSWT